MTIGVIDINCLWNGIVITDNRGKMKIDRHGTMTLVKVGGIIAMEENIRIGSTVDDIVISERDQKTQIADMITQDLTHIKTDIRTVVCTKIDLQNVTPTKTNLMNNHIPEEQRGNLLSILNRKSSRRHLIIDFVVIR